MPPKGYRSSINGYEQKNRRPRFILPPGCRIAHLPLSWDPQKLEAGFKLMRAPNGGYVTKQYPDLKPGEINFLLE